MKDLRINTFAVITVFAVLFLSFLTFNTVNAKERYEKTKHYESVLIEKGDTLSEISDRYITPEYKNKNEHITEIRLINHIIGDNIHEGSYIVVPCYGN